MSGSPSQDRVGLPDLYPCPACSGSGERKGAMTPSQQRERNRELRRAKAEGRPPHELDTVCLTCGGKGYSAKPYATRLSMPPDWANDNH
jgi:DnaJ-class molecular chaperone